MRDQEREQAWTKRLVAIAQFLEGLEEGKGVKGMEGLQLKELRVLLNTRDAGDTLLVVKGTIGQDKYVGFVGGRCVGEVLLTWRQKDAKKGLSFRPERPYGEAG